MSAPTLSHVDQWETHNNVVASRLLKHIRDEFGGNRRSAFILLVLARIWEERNDSGDSLCAGNLTGMDHDTEFHERCVDLATAGVDDIDIIFADRLCDANVRFANAGFRDRSSGNGYTETVGDMRSVREWKTVREYRLAMISASSG